MCRVVFVCFIVMSTFFVRQLRAQVVEDNYTRNTKSATVIFPNYRQQVFKGFLFLPDMHSLIQQSRQINIESCVRYVPFFCNMETALRKRFNIWIKLRAGNDELYRQMISKSNQL